MYEEIFEYTKRTKRTTESKTRIIHFDGEGKYKCEIVSVLQAIREFALEGSFLALYKATDLQNVLLQNYHSMLV